MGYRSTDSAAGTGCSSTAPEGVDSLDEELAVVAALQGTSHAAAVTPDRDYRRSSVHLGAAAAVSRIAP